MGMLKGRQAMLRRDDPPALRRAVEHAERLSDEVLLDERFSSLHDEWARAWLVGRAGEIDRFVEHVRASFREGRMDEAAAAGALYAYLDALHEGLARHIGPEARTACPGPRDDTTIDEDTVQKTVDALLLDLARREEP